MTNTRVSPFRIFLFLGFFLVAIGQIETGVLAQEKYSLGKDSRRQQDVPQGRVTDHVWKSKVFAGTIRRYSVYVPAQYDAKKPAALMVFQDGHAYADPKGQFRATVVMDNLIHKKEMPVTIGVFIDPGHLKNELPKQRGWRPTPGNRSFEYDTMSDQYSRFLLEEIIPEVSKSLNLTKDPEQRAICGISSGGICAFTVAWERPDQFRKVLSHVGSFVNIRGGHVYPALIRKTKKKPIRVFLQGGEKDLDNQHGNWPLGNQQMAKSLAFSKYDYRFEFGTEGHNGIHGGCHPPRVASLVVAQRLIMDENDVAAASTTKESKQLEREDCWPAWRKILFVAAFASAILVFYLIYNRYLTPEKITSAEANLRLLYSNHPIQFVATAFLIYTFATGLSLPIATVLSLSYAWILGWVAVPLLSLAATCGATLAFLSARFLFRDWVQSKYADKLRVINRGFERDGAFYIISLRMVAVFPYVVANLVLGLVPIRTRTYFLATMIGMLPLNFAFVYLGMQIPSTQEFLEHGMRSLISWQVILGIGLIGLVPLGLRILANRMSSIAIDSE